MTEMEQILQRLTSLERSVKTLQDMVSATQNKVWQVEHALREKKVELAEPAAMESDQAIIDTDHPLIIRIETLHGGEPVTRYSRISVRILVGCIKLGQTQAEIQEGYPHLSVAELCDALSYYIRHQAEIDGYLAADEAAHTLELSRIAERKKTGYKT